LPHFNPRSILRIYLQQQQQGCCHLLLQPRQRRRQQPLLACCRCRCLPLPPLPQALLSAAAAAASAARSCMTPAAVEPCIFLVLVSPATQDQLCHHHTSTTSHTHTLCCGCCGRHTRLCTPAPPPPPPTPPAPRLLLRIHPPPSAAAAQQPPHHRIHTPLSLLSSLPKHPSAFPQRNTTLQPTRHSLAAPPAPLQLAKMSDIVSQLRALDSKRAALDATIRQTQHRARAASAHDDRTAKRRAEEQPAALPAVASSVTIAHTPPSDARRLSSPRDKQVN